ncbi:MAG: hypothetical protein OJF50_003902 [Nitrospira sp.]|nr:hypothetical protein [Nitrospira sp.]
MIRTKAIPFTMYFMPAKPYGKEVGRPSLHKIQLTSFTP